MLYFHHHCRVQMVMQLRHLVHHQLPFRVHHLRIGIHLHRHLLNKQSWCQR